MLRLLLSPSLSPPFQYASSSAGLHVVFLAALTSFAAAQKVETPGPARIGSAEQIDDLNTWQKVAGHYAFGFRTDMEVYPFFSAK